MYNIIIVDLLGVGVGLILLVGRMLVNNSSESSDSDGIENFGNKR